MILLRNKVLQIPGLVCPGRLIGLIFLIFITGCAIGPDVPGQTVADRGLTWRIRNAIWKFEFIDGVKDPSLPEIANTEQLLWGETRVEELWVVDRDGVEIPYRVILEKQATENGESGTRIIVEKMAQ